MHGEAEEEEEESTAARDYLESTAKEHPLLKGETAHSGRPADHDIYKRKRKKQGRAITDHGRQSWHDGGGVESVESAPDLAERGRRRPAACDGEEDPLQLGYEAHHPARRRQQQREGQHPDAHLQDQHPGLLLPLPRILPGSSQLQLPADRSSSPPTRASSPSSLEMGIKRGGRLVSSLWA
ncbi:unnamed protein product [Urochloa decumbens]|uniref:Uncharacterized protein n=1 Tax=Urochloa decumbens TaxID=240449 RepID=A0ABC9E511_9POAL